MKTGRPAKERFDYSQLKYLAGALTVPLKKMSKEPTHPIWHDATSSELT